jgi:hypothetical protein
MKLEQLEIFFKPSPVFRMSSQADETQIEAQSALKLKKKSCRNSNSSFVTHTH